LPIADADPCLLKGPNGRGSVQVIKQRGSDLHGVSRSDALKMAGACGAARSKPR